MASPSSKTLQSQGGSDTSITKPLSAGMTSSKETTPAVEQRTVARKRIDFTLTFTLTPISPPTGISVS